MIDATWARELDLLRRAGAQLEPGLSGAELAAAEARVGAPFPPDLRALLAAALPAGGRFPDWRALDAPAMAEMLAWPADGVCFDVEHNGFWWPAWGERPADVAAALAVARRRVAGAPALVPVYGHRYLPAEPPEAGNPVLSVWQTDVIYYGRDLRDYLANEFGGAANLPGEDEPRHIPFWSDVVTSYREPAP